MARTDLDVGEPAPHNTKLHEAIDNLKHILEPHGVDKFLDDESTRTSLKYLIHKAKHALGTGDDTSVETSDTSDSDRGIHKKRYKVAMNVGKRLGKRVLKRQARKQWRELRAGILANLNTAVDSWDSVNGKLREAKRQFKKEWRETKRKAKEMV